MARCRYYLRLALMVACFFGGLALGMLLFHLF